MFNAVIDSAGKNLVNPVLRLNLPTECTSNFISWDETYQSQGEGRGGESAGLSGLNPVLRLNVFCVGTSSHNQGLTSFMHAV